MLGGEVTLRAEEANQFVELSLQPSDKAIDRPLQSLGLPENVNVVSVERAGMIIIPRGSTVFMVGDIVTVFGHRDVMKEVKALFTTSARKTGDNMP